MPTADWMPWNSGSRNRGDGNELLCSAEPDPPCEGDSAEIRLVICDRVTGEPFIPGKHDELAFTLKQNFADEKPVLTKTLEQASGRRGGVLPGFLAGRYPEPSLRPLYL